MGATFVVRDLLSRTREDVWRRTNPFSEGIRDAQKVLFHPYATDADRQFALNSWFQNQQPCLFGRVAGAANTIHYLFLDDDDLRQSDQYISDRIQESRLAWRQRSLSPREGVSLPAHGFVLALVSERLAIAEPDDALKQLALEILRLWNCDLSKEPQGEVHWEDLYLENPQDQSYVRFTFSIDFFSAAGDGRWWQDHRIPGGIAFTANSVGHMRRYREWYLKKNDQLQWLLATAMETIARATVTPYGQATWLRPLVDGKPFVREVVCPISNPKPAIADKDWTRYAGHLHTDHSVRPEFFRAEPEKPTEAKTTEWVQDFQYLYDRGLKDHLRFSEGIAVSKQEVEEKVGRPEDVVVIASPKTRTKPGGGAKMYDGDRRAEIEPLLDVLRKWSLTAEEIENLNAV